MRSAPLCFHRRHRPRPLVLWRANSRTLFRLRRRQVAQASCLPIPSEQSGSLRYFARQNKRPCVTAGGDALLRTAQSGHSVAAMQSNAPGLPLWAWSSIAINDVAYATSLMVLSGSGAWPENGRSRPRCHPNAATRSCVSAWRSDRSDICQIGHRRAEIARRSAGSGRPLSRCPMPDVRFHDCLRFDRNSPCANTRATSLWPCPFSRKRSTSCQTVP